MASNPFFWVELAIGPLFNLGLTYGPFSYGFGLGYNLKGSGVHLGFSWMTLGKEAISGSGFGQVEFGMHTPVQALNWSRPVFAQAVHYVQHGAAGPANGRIAPTDAMPTGAAPDDETPVANASPGRIVDESVVPAVAQDGGGSPEILQTYYAGPFDRYGLPPADNSTYLTTNMKSWLDPYCTTWPVFGTVDPYAQHDIEFESLNFDPNVWSEYTDDNGYPITAPPAKWTYTDNSGKHFMESYPIAKEGGRYIYMYQEVANPNLLRSVTDQPGMSAAPPQNLSEGQRVMMEKLDTLQELGYKYRWSLDPGTLRQIKGIWYTYFSPPLHPTPDPFTFGAGGPHVFDPGATTDLQFANWISSMRTVVTYNPEVFDYSLKMSDPDYQQVLFDAIGGFTGSKGPGFESWIYTPSKTPPIIVRQYHP